jgi:hypothetical protein
MEPAQALRKEPKLISSGSSHMVDNDTFSKDFKLVFNSRKIGSKNPAATKIRMR